MSDFTIKVYREPGNAVLPSEVDVIGNQLTVLANQLPELVKNEAVIHRTSEMHEYATDKNQNWTDDAIKAAETLFGALSFQLWNGNNLVREVGHDDTTKNVHDHVKLIFVFEEEGQMVVPVPTVKNISRGEQHAPLRLPAQYDKLVSEGTAAEMGRRMATAIANAPGGELSKVWKELRGEIVTEIVNIAEEMRAEIEGDADVFKAQLGDYSVRQCCGG